MEKIHGELGVRGGCEDRALIVLQDLEPGTDISGVIVANLRDEFKIGSREGAAQLVHDERIPAVNLQQ